MRLQRARAYRRSTKPTDARADRSAQRGRGRAYHGPTPRRRSLISSSARSPRLWLFARAALDALVLEVGSGRPPRRGQHRRRRRRRRHQRSIVDHVRLSRSDARGTSAAKRPASFAPADPSSAANRDAAAVADRPCARDRRAAAAHAACDFGFVAEGTAVAISRSRRRALRTADPGIARTPSAWATPRSRLPCSMCCASDCLCRRGAIREALLHGRAGRGASRCCPAGRPIVLDVAHNPHAARVLSARARRDGIPSGRRMRCSACSPTRTSAA